MLKEIIEGYNKKKLEFIRSLAGSQEDAFNEVLFVDDGEIETRINQTKEEYRQIEKEISFLSQYDKQDEERAEKLRFLMGKCKDLREIMAFWASNNLQNLEMCVGLIQKDNPPFLRCLLALQSFAKKDSTEAYDIIQHYLEDGGDFARHFLLNKVYAQLLMVRGENALAERYLYRAQRLRPWDSEVNRLFGKLYRARNYDVGVRICDGIMEMVG